MLYKCAHPTHMWCEHHDEGEKGTVYGFLNGVSNNSKTHKFCNETNKIS